MEQTEHDRDQQDPTDGLAWKLAAAVVVPLRYTTHCCQSINCHNSSTDIWSVSLAHFLEIVYYPVLNTEYIKSAPCHISNKYVTNVFV